MLSFINAVLFVALRGSLTHPSLSCQVESHRKAAAATAAGKFKDEIVPVHTKVI